MFGAQVITALTLALLSLPAMAAPQQPGVAFPDGQEHDFGKLQRGTRAWWAIRVINTSRTPVRISAVRANVCASPFYARCTRPVLNPGQETQIEVEVDTRRFEGSKTGRVWLHFENGSVTTLTLSAESTSKSP